MNTPFIIICWHWKWINVDTAIGMKPKVKCIHPDHSFKEAINYYSLVYNAGSVWSSRRCPGNSTEENKNLEKVDQNCSDPNSTHVLGELLNGYDPRIRPGARSEWFTVPPHPTLGIGALYSGSTGIYVTSFIHWKSVLFYSFLYICCSKMNAISTPNVLICGGEWPARNPGSRNLGRQWATKYRFSSFGFFFSVLYFQSTWAAHDSCSLKYLFWGHFPPGKQ